LQSEIHKLINSIWNKEELPDQWRSLIFWLCLGQSFTTVGNEMQFAYDYP
jgi:hypothetical protein